jgi:dTDP-4-dehydrorhamnose 3,5-epimerase
MSLRFVPSFVDGVGRICAPTRNDVRGGFTKIFSTAALAEAGIDFQVREVFWSISRTGVIRGLHFQTPPAAVAKIVFATQGVVRDVVLDIRVGSPTYGEVFEHELSEGSGAVLIPRGCAHGFEVIEGPAVTCYLQDGPFDPAADAGIRWDSVGIAWTTAEPIVSVRDRALPSLDPASPAFPDEAAARVG